MFRPIYAFAILLNVLINFGIPAGAVTLLIMSGQILQDDLLCELVEFRLLLMLLDFMMVNILIYFFIKEAKYISLYIICYFMYIALVACYSVIFYFLPSSVIDDSSVMLVRDNFSLCNILSFSEFAVTFSLFICCIRSMIDSCRRPSSHKDTIQPRTVAPQPVHMDQPNSIPILGTAETHITTFIDIPDDNIIEPLLANETTTPIVVNVPSEQALDDVYAIPHPVTSISFNEPENVVPEALQVVIHDDEINEVVPQVIQIEDENKQEDDKVTSNENETNTNTSLNIENEPTVVNMESYFKSTSGDLPSPPNDAIHEVENNEAKTEENQNSDVAEISLPVEVMNHDEVLYNENSDTSSKLSPVSVKPVVVCGACGKHDAVVELHPCDDCLCQNCMASGRCPCCGCIIISTTNI